MILITGGAFQGKREFSQKLGISQRTRQSETLFVKDCSRDMPCPEEEVDIIYGIHLFVRELLKAGVDPWDKIKCLVQKNPEVIIVVDELGCGIVPMEAFDREWREVTGRICCWLAGESDMVYRVVCGMGTRIK